MHEILNYFYSSRLLFSRSFFVLCLLIASLIHLIVVSYVQSLLSLPFNRAIYEPEHKMVRVKLGDGNMVVTDFKSTNLKELLSSVEDKSSKLVTKQPVASKEEKKYRDFYISSRSQNSNINKEVISKGKASGYKYGNSQVQETIIKRYEQILSLWFNKHKNLPTIPHSLPKEISATLYITINRSGNILFSSLYEGTGSPLLDKAILDMVKRANPVPAVPDNYPAGESLDFLIPMKFYLD